MSKVLSGFRVRVNVRAIIFAFSNGRCSKRYWRNSTVRIGLKVSRVGVLLIVSIVVRAKILGAEGQQRRALCCSRSAMSWLSCTVIDAGRMTSISTMYRAPKWYALTCIPEQAHTKSALKLET